MPASTTAIAIISPQIKELLAGFSAGDWYSIEGYTRSSSMLMIPAPV